MTGFGSPCGACKFLRRKCVRGCVFAPYFCHEQGATHFAAIHKIFGASNVSKLLTHLPVTDRCEAAVTISYEAQARLQDPIYGCVSHIFALQQQVVSLQAQLASLKAQLTQGVLVNDSASRTTQEEKLQYGDNFPTIYPQNIQGLVHLSESKIMSNHHHQQRYNQNSAMEIDEAMLYYDHDNGVMDQNPVCSTDYNQQQQQHSTSSVLDENVHHHQYMMSTTTSTSFDEQDATSHHHHAAMASLVDIQTNTAKWVFQDNEDLQSMAFAYLQHSS